MKLKLILFILVSILSFSFAQQRGFDSKKHKDSSSSNFLPHSQVIDGRNSSKNDSIKTFYRNRNQSLSLKNTFSRNVNLRKVIESQVIYSKETHLPIFIASPKFKNQNTRAEMLLDKKSATFSYIKSLENVLGISNSEKIFKINTIENAQNGKSHIRLNQFQNGIKVFGSEVVVHLDANGYGEIFNGHYFSLPHNLDSVPQINQRQCLETVLEDITSNSTFIELNAFEKQILNYHSPKIDTFYYSSDNFNFKLCYLVNIIPNIHENWEYIVDAKNGQIIEKIKNSCHVDGSRTASATDLTGTSRIINTYQVGSNYYFIDATKSMFNLSQSVFPDEPRGAIHTFDMNNTFGTNATYTQIFNNSNVWNNPKAVSAHYNAGKAFDYFKNAHNRNSIDGKGGTIYSLINVVDESGNSMDNAYWNGKAMFYGNGDVAFNPLARGLDVAGHEMTHGVIQNTAQLRYQGESGAINESMADIFGCMMDTTDWLIGEDVVKLSAFPSGALRSISDPHNGGTSLNDAGYQPRIYSERYTGTQDNGGVHINSGIPNWAFYKLATAINSRKRAADIFYKALSTYLTANSKFIDLRIAVIQSAKDLYGDSSNEAAQAIIAFDQVEIIGDNGGNYSSTLPTNPGDEYLLSYDTDNNTNLGLLRSTPSAQNFVNLTNKVIKTKPSVTDDGTKAVYVGTDGKIYSINIQPNANYTPTLLSNLTNWSSVAISKDGTKLAATTNSVDTAIYVRAINGTTWTKFKLYNPTNTQDNVRGNGPLYADALEWSYDGEYLIYDCFNSLRNSSGTNIEYWDINIIKVWNNSVNSVSDGEVFKIFNNLEPGESIGNPTLSKNSPNIIAFDYFDDAGSYAIFGLNLETNDLNVITNNDVIGFPSFNKTDDKLAFTTLTNSNSTATSIYSVNLNSDKISSVSSSLVSLIQDVKWPIYFAIGNRNTNSIDASDYIKNENIEIFPNPAKSVLNIKFKENSSSKIEITIFNHLGQIVKNNMMNTEPENIYIIDISNLLNGIYFIHINTNEKYQTLKFVKD